MLGNERVRSLCVPEFELPVGARMQFGASRIGYHPFLLHSQIAKPSLVDDPWNNIWCVCWWDEILEVPTIAVTEHSMRKEGEGNESVEQGEKNGQPMVEDDDWDGEKSDSTVVVALERERRYHVDDTRDGRRKVLDAVEESKGCQGRTPVFP